VPLFASYTVEICLTTEEKLTTFMPCPSLRVIYWKFALQLRKSLQLSGRAPLCELYFGNLPYNLGKAYNFRAVPLFASYILEICLTTEEKLSTFVPCPSLRVIYWKFALQLRKTYNLQQSMSCFY